MISLKTMIKNISSAPNWRKTNYPSSENLVIDKAKALAESRGYKYVPDNDPEQWIQTKDGKPTKIDRDAFRRAGKEDQPLLAPRGRRIIRDWHEPLLMEAAQMLEEERQTTFTQKMQSEKESPFTQTRVSRQQAAFANKRKLEQQAILDAQKSSSSSSGSFSRPGTDNDERAPLLRRY